MPTCNICGSHIPVTEVHYAGICDFCSGLKQREFQPIQQPQQQQPEYVETTDLMFGKKGYKRLPQAENWIR